MIHKLRTAEPGYIHVIFELPACLWADHIYVVGDHNHWNPTATPMQQDRAGVWRAEVDLRIGSTCEFRYLVDDHWLTDYHADGCTINQYGSSNSVVIATLPEEKLQVPRLRSQVWENVSLVTQQVRKKAQRRSWANRRIANNRATARSLRRVPVARR